MSVSVNTGVTNASLHRIDDAYYICCFSTTQHHGLTAQTQILCICSLFKKKTNLISIFKNVIVRSQFVFSLLSFLLCRFHCQPVIHLCLVYFEYVQFFSQLSSPFWFFFLIIIFGLNKPCETKINLNINQLSCFGFV